MSEQRDAAQRHTDWWDKAVRRQEEEREEEHRRMFRIFSFVGIAIGVILATIWFSAPLSAPRQRVVCWSDGAVIYDGVSDGEVLSCLGGGFRFRSSGRTVMVSGDCVVRSPVEEDE